VSAETIVNGILNPGVLFVLFVSGLAYGRLLWALNLRPAATLLTIGLSPGVIYLVTIWAMRAAQGTPSLVWCALLVDWLVFAGTAVGAVLLARRAHA
jgi:hypothetical protein